MTKISNYENDNKDIETLNFSIIPKQYGFITLYKFKFNF